MSPIQWPRILSEASLAASSLDVRKTSRSADHLIAGRVVEFLQGDLADDLVAEIAPGPRATGWRDEGYGKREGDKMPEQVRVEVQSAAILISVRSSSKMAESSLNRCWRSITECPYTWSP